MPPIAPEPPLSVLRGKLTTYRRRCGKPSCRCATGDRHESPALLFSEDGRTKTLTLTPAEATEVAAALQRYAAAQAELDGAADAALAALRSRRAVRRGRR